MTATVHASTSTTLPDFWKFLSTATSDENSCRGSIRTFLSMYPLIHDLNEPVIKNFHKAFSYKIGDQIFSDEKILKKICPYFAIYPFSEYTQLINSNETQLQSRADLSIILKLIQQITVIFEHNIQKQDVKTQNLCDMLSILVKNNDSLNEKDDNHLLINPNLMVIEMKQFPDVFCFFTTIPQNKNNSPLSFKKLKEQLWMENFGKDILISSIIPQENLKSFGAKEIISLLTGFGKAIKSEFTSSDILECLFIEKTISYKNVTFKVNSNFLHEFYILVQVSKLCQKLSKQFGTKTSTAPLMNEIASLKRKSRESIIDLSKDRLDTVIRYFDLSNENYKFIISLIGREYFAERLVLLEDTYISDLIKPNFIKEISPLKMFKAFLMRIQVI